MEKKKYVVHLAAYYTADVIVEAKDKEEAKKIAEQMEDVEYEYTDQMESDCWEASEEEIEGLAPIDKVISFEDDVYDKAKKVYDKVKEYIIDNNGIELAKGMFIQVCNDEYEVYEITKLKVRGNTIYGYVEDCLEEWLILSLPYDYPQLAYALNNIIVMSNIKK